MSACDTAQEDSKAVTFYTQIFQTICILNALPNVYPDTGGY